MTDEEKKQINEFCDLIRVARVGPEIPGEDWVQRVHALIPQVHNLLGHEVAVRTAPIPMLLWCPECGKRHIDEGAFSGPLPGDASAAGADEAARLAASSCSFRIASRPSR